MIYLIIFEILIIFILIQYNIHTSKNLFKVSKTKEKVEKLMVLKDILKVISSSDSVKSKLKTLNSTVINALKIDYSTIVYFTGDKYEVKITNVNNDLINQVGGLERNSAFATAIAEKESKYIEATMEKSLPYVNEQKQRVQSCLFVPIYNKEVFSGYWLIESKSRKELKDLDLNFVNTLKDSILDAMLTLGYEQTIESQNRTDLYSGLNTKEYMFTEGKRNLDRYNISTITMLRIANLEEINEKFSREMGNKVVTSVSNRLSEILKQEIFVRYMGPKFLIAFEGKNKESIENNLKNIKMSLESNKLEIDENNNITMNYKSVPADLSNKIQSVGKLHKDLPENIIENIINLTPEKINEYLNKNFNDNVKRKEVRLVITLVSAHYYRGTSLDVVVNNLENHLEDMRKGNIDYI